MPFTEHIKIGGGYFCAVNSPMAIMYYILHKCVTIELRNCLCKMIKEMELCLIFKYHKYIEYYFDLNA